MRLFDKAGSSGPGADEACPDGLGAIDTGRKQALASAEDRGAGYRAHREEPATRIAALVAQVEGLRGQVNLAQMATRAAEQQRAAAEGAYASELASKAREIDMLKEFLRVAKTQKKQVSEHNERLERCQGEAQRERNEARARAAAAERRVRRLEKDLQERDEQLEYTQQRLLQTAAFRLVRSPFELEGEGETAVAGDLVTATAAAACSVDGDDGDDDIAATAPEAVNASGSIDTQGRQNQPG